MQINPDLLKFLGCPANTAHTLEVRPSSGLYCFGCNKTYPIVQNRVFFSDYPKNVSSRGVTPASQWSRWRKSNFDYFLHHLGHVSKDRVLFDIGAGPTNFRELLLRFDTYVGVDFFPFELVSVVTDLTKTLPFRDASCDIVFVSNVLEHIPNPNPLLQECYRVLKSGGIIIGAVPFLGKVHQAPYDFNRYTNFMLEKILRESGFANSEITSLGTLFDTYQSIQRAFFNLLLESTFSQSRFKHLRTKFLARLGRKISYTTTSLFQSVFSFVPASDMYPQGYGFKAVKL